MQALCLYGTRKSKPESRENNARKQQHTVTLFEYDYLAHVIVLWQMQKFMCYCTVFALIYFEFEGTSQALAPKGLHVALAVTPGGGGTWVFFGWVCAARDSKLAPRSRKNFP